MKDAAFLHLIWKDEQDTHGWRGEEGLLGWDARDVRGWEQDLEKIALEDRLVSAPTAEFLVTKPAQ